MKVEIINRSEHKLPAYETLGAAGMDIKAYISEVVRVWPKKTVIIPTGLYFAVPEGYELQVRSRSGLAARNGLFVLNSPGTVDSDYRGEIKVILHNTSDESFYVSDGDRIAQVVLKKVERIELEVVEKLSKTLRGEGGFGSTGVADQDTLRAIGNLPADRFGY
jgi:dUTP pyrophosphatase